MTGVITFWETNVTLQLNHILHRCAQNSYECECIMLNTYCFFVVSSAQVCVCGKSHFIFRVFSLGNDNEIEMWEKETLVNWQYAFFFQTCLCWYCVRWASQVCLFINAYSICACVSAIALLKWVLELYWLFFLARANAFLLHLHIFLLAQSIVCHIKA